jgi:hypothetical protein
MAAVSSSAAPGGTTGGPLALGRNAEGDNWTDVMRRSDTWSEEVVWSANIETSARPRMIDCTTVYNS